MRRILWTGLVVAVGCGAARGTVLVSEDFAYTAGQPLAGQNGGTGFSGAWVAGAFSTIVSNYTATAGSLSVPGEVSTGNSVTAPVDMSGWMGATRGFASTFGTAGTTLYISMLVRAEGTVNQGDSFGFFGMYLNTSGTNLYMGKTGGGADPSAYTIENQGGTGLVSSGVDAVSGRTVQLLVRADFAAGFDTFTLYVDPGATEPLTGAVKSDSDVGTVSGLSLFSSGAFSVDEIKIATTYGEVAPATPLPAGWGMGGVGLVLAGAIGVRRRARVG